MNRKQTEAAQELKAPKPTPGEVEQALTEVVEAPKSGKGEIRERNFLREPDFLRNLRRHRSGR